VEARELALKIINDIEGNGAYANIALSREINRHRLTDQDRRFTTELVYGTTKAGETLDWLLSHYSNRPMSKVVPVIRNILRMGIYQLFFLTKVPPSAACNEAVNLAKKYGHAGTVKFVNAVLRNAARSPEKAAYPDPKSEPVRYLSLKYFHPEWLVTLWLSRWGFDECEKLLKINNETPPLCLRTNTLKINRENLLKRLQIEGASCEASVWTPEGIVCLEHPALNNLPSLQEGLIQVQDESSMLVSHVLAPQPGEFIIDACGAPGGKSTHIAALMNNNGRLLSTDLHDHKLKLTEENAKRLGITILETQALDATTLHLRYAGQADRVLVDAPCSGLGVLRRKPDSRWRKNQAMLRDLPVLQLAILESAAECVKTGGVLVYSTCTTEPQENEQVVEAFLRSHSEYTLEPVGSHLPVQRDAVTLQLWPHVDGVDGFFIARMRRLK
jgi:16S rRNA (cytosine967-C5)-methyltransferase